MAPTYVKCSTCGKTEEIGAAEQGGWLIAQRKDKRQGYLVIRCPEHRTEYAERQARK